MEGIQYFPNLVTLDCSKNQLTSLNLSSNSKLGYLDCGKNQLTQLTLPNTTYNLERLHCYSNQLTALDIGRFENLKDLSCGSNPLGTLESFISRLNVINPQMHSLLLRDIGKVQDTLV